MLKKYLSNQRGLTLVELLAVVVILGIVSTIAVVSIGNVIQNSREDAVRADAIQILNAAELYVSSGGEIGTTATIGPDELGDTLAREGAFEDVTWTVGRNLDGQLTITATNVPAGSTTMNFNGATVNQINDGKGKVDIP